MIPTLPLFKKIELSDKHDVERITSHYLPYSDFNFVSMWSWDVKEEIEIAELHNNLIVRLSDYLTGDPVYSFLGNNQTTETVEKLLEFAKQQTGLNVLKYVPEDSLQGLDTSRFIVQEDRDHFDYIYSLEELATLKGHKFESKRGFLHRFLKHFPEFAMERINLLDPSIQKKIVALNDVWTKNKLVHGKNPQSTNEALALERLFISAEHFNIVAFGLFIKNELAGFTIDEFIGESSYALSHFIKGDIDVVGIFPMLLYASCADFLKAGRHLFNYEQDLGLPGLRKAKESYRPVTYLRKYSIRPATESHML